MSIVQCNMNNTVWAIILILFMKFICWDRDTQHKVQEKKNIKKGIMCERKVNQNDRLPCWVLWIRGIAGFLHNMCKLLRYTFAYIAFLNHEKLKQKEKNSMRKN